MATESEIKNYSTLLSDTKIQGLKNIKQTYVDQISQAKTDLDKANFTDWEDSVSTKFKNHYDSLKTNYSTIATDVGDGSNLDTLITLVSGLKTKCDEYLKYRNEYNSISTGVYFSDEKLKKEYNDYKNGRIKYKELSQSVKNAINNNNSKLKRKETLEGLMDSCSSTIDTTLTNIKSITFNASSEQTAGIQTDFTEETAPQDNEHYTSEQVIQIYQDSKEKYEELMEMLRNLDYSSDDIESQIDAIMPGALQILTDYFDATFLMYLKGEMSYDEYKSLTNEQDMIVIVDNEWGFEYNLYDTLYDNSSQPHWDEVNACFNHNDEYRTFADRFNSNGCSSQEFLQNVPPLSALSQEGVILDYNSVESASQYAVASLVELLENGYTGDVVLIADGTANDTFYSFNNKAGDTWLWGGFMDSAKHINNTYVDYYYNNGGAFNGNNNTTAQEGGSGTHTSKSGEVHGGGVGREF